MTTLTPDRLLHHLIQRLEGTLADERRPGAARDLHHVVALLRAAADTLDTLGHPGGADEIAATD